MVKYQTLYVNESLWHRLFWIPKRKVLIEYASWNIHFFFLQSQQIEINFVRQGGHVNAIGAFVEGVKQKT